MGPVCGILLGLGKTRCVSPSVAVSLFFFLFALHLTLLQTVAMLDTVRDGDMAAPGAGVDGSGDGSGDLSSATSSLGTGGSEDGRRKSGRGGGSKKRRWKHNDPAPLLIELEKALTGAALCLHGEAARERGGVGGVHVGFVLLEDKAVLMLEPTHTHTPPPGFSFSTLTHALV